MASISTPIPTIPDDAYREAIQVIQIQDTLLNLTKASYSSAIDSIFDSIYLSTEERVIEFTHHLLISVQYRVKNVAVYADLVQFLISKKADFPALNNFESFILDEISSEITSERVGRSCMQLITFLSKCYLRNVYTDDQIIQFVRTNFHNKDARQISVLHLFSHFCYLIDRIDQSLYKSHIKLFESLAKKDPESPASMFLKELDDWKENEWFTLQVLLSHDYNGMTLEGALIMDDDINFKTCLNQPNFLPDSCMQTNLFTPSSMLETNPTLIQYAAYFGSQKCFDLLLQHKANVKLETYKGCSTINFAASGGNMNILNSLDKLKFDFKGASHYAAMNLHYDALIWCLENKDKLSSRNVSNLGTPFECAATSNFIKAILFFIEKGVEVNYLATGATPLFYACAFGNVDAVRLLLAHKNINPDIRDVQGIFFIIFSLFKSSISLH